jgi:hypothetical protein
VVELSPLRAQADFNVGSARALSDLRKGRGEKLIPTRAVTDLVLALVTPQAAAELLGVNPFHELGGNHFFGMHRPSRANGAYLRDFPIATSYLLPDLAFCGSKSSFVQVRSNLRTSMNTGTSSKRIQ